MKVGSTAEDNRRIANRLKRAHGQLGALITAVETDGDCRAVITQLSAVSSALDRAGFAIVAAALKDCLDDGDAAGDMSIEELEKLFLTLA